MSFIQTAVSIWESNRERTLETLQAISQLPDPQAALAWQPGPGRAHIGWQLTHIAVVEELFATERLSDRKPDFADLVARFQRGTAADANVPTLKQIHELLAATRAHLLTTAAALSDADLDRVPPGLAARGWSIRKALQIITWHEPHHQGQAHLTLNLFKARQDG